MAAHQCWATVPHIKCYLIQRYNVTVFCPTVKSNISRVSCRWLQKFKINVEESSLIPSSPYLYSYGGWVTHCDSHFGTLKSSITWNTHRNTQWTNSIFVYFLNCFNTFSGSTQNIQFIKIQVYAPNCFLIYKFIF